MFLEFISSFLFMVQKGVFSVGPFIILLGVLIFIHELGHFLAARYCGVRVEVFSLGFGPKILKYKRGDTVYCLSLFPLGGYVKMFGDNPFTEVPQEEKQYGFLYKKVPQKLMIAFAGPFMNLIFTLFAFLLLGWIGIPAIPAILGDITKDTPAYKVGFRSGDKILSVNKEKISDWGEFNKVISSNPSKNLSVSISSLNKDLKKYNVSPASIANSNIFSFKKKMGAISGLSPFSTGTQVGVKFNSPAYKAGLRTFDTIKKINGKQIRYWRDLRGSIKKTKKNLSLSITRENKNLEIQFSKRYTFNQLGVEPTDLYILKVGANTPAESAGIKKGDRLIAIDGTTVNSWDQVLNTIKNHSGQGFKIKYQRAGKTHNINVSPKIMYVEGNLKERSMLGIASASFKIPPEQFLKKESFFGAFVFSGKQTAHWLKVISVGLLRLVQGQLSVRTLGGPVTIGRVAHSSFQTGFVSFLFVMALISLNLFFLNLLPIPILDGGHILFFTIEGIMGRPLDTKKLIIAQNIGLLVLLSFFALTFFNDIYNWLNAW